MVKIIFLTLLLFFNNTFSNDEIEIKADQFTYDKNSTRIYATGNVEIITYGVGTACRADIFKFKDVMHRATSEGAVPLDANLNLNMVAKVGELNGVYSGKVLNDELVLGTTDYSAPDTVFLFNSSNELLQTFEVNVLPGDFAVYNN